MAIHTERVDVEHQILQTFRPDSEDGSPIPEWISQNTPEKPTIDLNSSDSEKENLIDLASQPSPQIGKSKTENGKVQADKAKGAVGVAKPKNVVEALAKAGMTINFRFSPAIAAYYIMQKLQSAFPCAFVDQDVSLQ